MNHKAHILVVDDEPQVVALLCEGFEVEGFAVSEATNKAELAHYLDSEKVDLITLDLGLPDEDGLLLARKVRAKHNVPIIMITGRNSPADRLTGLEFGADDYIVKPFLMREVILRARTVLSRYESLRRDGPMPGSHQERYVFEGGILDVRKRELETIDGTLVAVPAIELQLLTMFLRHPQRVLSRDEITQVIYGRDWSPHDRGLDVHITRLRKKIQKGDNRLIMSVRNVGYVFTGEVELV
jgi:DNA-binding response OmpR family regulator